MASDIEREYYNWRQDTPMQQLASLFGAIVGTLENMRDGTTTDYERSARSIVGFAASLNALAPRLKDNRW